MQGGRRSNVIGVDEVGRGALAGPIVAAAIGIRWPRRFPFSDVTDSKLLTDAERRRLVPFIQKSCVIRYGLASHRMIDQIGIQQANVLIDELAVQGLRGRAAEIHCDYIAAFAHYATRPFQITFHVNGERARPEIAAASIVAKVFRDDLMISLARRYPAYGFERHKGYGTAEHRKTILRYGPSPVHRLSFGR